MTKTDLQQMRSIMIDVFNDGCEQVIFPRLEEMEKNIKHELREEFKKGQQSLSNRLEEVEADIGKVNTSVDKMQNDINDTKDEMKELNGKMDQVVSNDKYTKKRIDRLERVVKAN